QLDSTRAASDQLPSERVKRSLRRPVPKRLDSSHHDQSKCGCVRRLMIPTSCLRLPGHNRVQMPDRTLCSDAPPCESDSSVWEGRQYTFPQKPRPAAEDCATIVSPLHHSNCPPLQQVSAATPSRRCVRMKRDSIV